MLQHVPSRLARVKAYGVDTLDLGGLELDYRGSLGSHV